MKSFYTLLILTTAFSVKSFSQCPPTAAFDFLDINEVEARINQGGDLWWNYVDQAGYEVPNDSGVHSLYGGAIWIGGLDDMGDLHVAAQTYRQKGNDFWAGPLDANGSVTQGVCEQWDKIWKVRRTDIDDFIATYNSIGAPIPVGQIPASILDWPSTGNPYCTDALNNLLLINQDIAPFVDVDLNGEYDPTGGDYPDVPGDECLFWVFNDNGNIHGETGGVPMKIEVHAMAFAFTDITYCLEYTTFYKYEIINRSGVDYDSVCVGKWTDVEMGDYSDDYLGCDTLRDLGIGYNGDTIDGPGIPNYGSTPPIIAIDLLENSAFANNDLMSSFVVYINNVANQQNGDPMLPIHYYNFLRGLLKDGSPLTYGGYGYGGSQIFPWMFPDDPSDTSGWSECTEANLPADRRFIMGSGPFDFTANENFTFAYAVEWVRPPLGSYPCPSFSSITDCADFIQTIYDNVINTKVEDLKNQTLNIYPNPFTDYFIIDLSAIADRENLSLEIFNLQGELLRSIKDIRETKLKIERGNLDTGLYIMKLNSSSTEYAQMKLIII